MENAQFHALYQRHARDVHRFAFFLSGRHAKAEDITAETFVRAWTAPVEIRTETVKAYLFAIVRNLVREDLRKHGGATEVDGDPVDARPGPTQLVDGRLELRAVLQCLQQLPESDRAALLMRAQDGMSYEEIARVLGLSVAALRVKVHRARLVLNQLKIRQERLP